MPIVRIKAPAKFTPEDIARHKKLAALPDSAIDFSDIPELGEEFFKKAKPLSQHGGLRPNSGRKRSGHIRLTLSVSPTFRRKLQQKADREGLTLSAYVETHLVG